MKFLSFIILHIINFKTYLNFRQVARLGGHPNSAQAGKARYRVSRFEELPSKLIGSLKSSKQISSLSLRTLVGGKIATESD